MELLLQLDPIYAEQSQAAAQLAAKASPPVSASPVILNHMPGEPAKPAPVAELVSIDMTVAAVTPVASVAPVAAGEAPPITEIKLVKSPVLEKAN